MNKLLTFYSNSHLEIYTNYFLPSFKKHLASSYELLVLNTEQLSPTGVWASPGFDVMMMEKIQWIIKNINLNDDSILVFSDCDVQFFGDLKFNLKNNDIMFQNDYNSHCAGFCICKQNLKTLNFFKLVEQEFKSLMNGQIDDQAIINKIILQTTNDIKIGLLDSDLYWTVANSTKGAVWSDQPVVCPKTILMHHANWTIGIKNKIQLLQIVRDQIHNYI